MTQVAILFLASLACVFVFAEDRTPQPLMTDRLQWSSPPPLPGLSFAWVHGTEQNSGLYALRVKLEPGTKIPPHTHPDQRLSTVISGTLYVGFGEEFDATKLVAIAAGDAYIAPANLAHFIWAKQGAVVYQETGIGPTATQLIKP